MCTYTHRLYTQRFWNDGSSSCYGFVSFLTQEHWRWSPFASHVPCPQKRKLHRRELATVQQPSLLTHCPRRCTALYTWPCVPYVTGSTGVCSCHTFCLTSVWVARTCVATSPRSSCSSVELVNFASLFEKIWLPVHPHTGGPPACYVLPVKL